MEDSEPILEDVPTPRNTTSTVEDLITLPVLDESALLQNIKIRFDADLIYTWVGSILVSMNPYQLLPIYLPAVAQKYIQRSSSLPPHIFAVSDKTYKDMRREDKNQSVLISGESGAGKTEATKLILQYLAALTSKRSRVEQMILEASPILEAFGNAKTVRNNNSSRFGRFSEIQFGSESAGIVGARIVDYLLEKSRVVYQAPTERNYHIFYQLCAGATDAEKVELKLQTPAEYKYLNQSGCVNVEGVDDADDFDQLRNALASLNILPTVQAVIFRVLSAILTLGNVEFQAKGDGCDVSGTEMVTIVAELLRVDVERLKQALTIKLMNIRGQSISVPLKPPEAVDSRDALAKSLYGRLFSWLVKSINHSLSASADKIRSFIGILDIYHYTMTFQIFS